MIEPVTTGPATSAPAPPQSVPTERAPHDEDAGATGEDPREGGHAEDAPRSLHAVELVADDEPIASNDEWDDPERL